MVAGAAALLLQDEPSLTPDQVKYRLIATAHPFDTRTRAGAGYLDVYAAVHGTKAAVTHTPNLVFSSILAALFGFEANPSGLTMPWR